MAEVSAASHGFLRDAGFEISAFGPFEKDGDRVVARIAPASVQGCLEHVCDRAN